MSVARKQKTLGNEVKALIRFGIPQKDIELACIRNNPDLDQDEIRREVDEIVSNFGDYGLIQKIMRGKIVREMSSREMWILDPVTKSRKETTREVLFQTINPKLDITEKFYTCEFIYNPFLLKQIYRDETEDWIYNKYHPPTWQSDYFFSGGVIEIEKVSEIPKIYKEFFMHLVEGDQPSYDYLVKWLANAVQFRNYCILTTIGEQGIGKGRLSEILKLIFQSNYKLTSKRVLKSDFNGQIKNIRLLYINEASVRSEEQEERIKVLVDNELEIEAKGKDAEHIENYASIFFSSNSYDSIRLENQDRRFSIINLTKTKLKDVWEFDKINQLTMLENVEELAKFLYYFPVNRKEMLDVFMCAHTEKIREASLTGWQVWFVDEYCIDNAGKIIKADTVIEQVTEKYPKMNLSYTGLKKLEAVYPKKFKVYKPTISGKQVWALKFPEKEHKDESI